MDNKNEKGRSYKQGRSKSQKEKSHVSESGSSWTSRAVIKLIKASIYSLNECRSESTGEPIMGSEQSVATSPTKAVTQAAQENPEPTELHRSPSALVVCGPSGVGKGTLIELLLEDSTGFAFSISHTTRPPRGQEKVSHHISIPRAQKCSHSGWSGVQFCVD